MHHGGGCVGGGGGGGGSTGGGCWMRVRDSGAAIAAIGVDTTPNIDIWACCKF